MTKRVSRPFTANAVPRYARSSAQSIRSAVILSCQIEQSQPRSLLGKLVKPIVQRTAFQRKTTAADAVAEVIAQWYRPSGPIVQFLSPPSAYALSAALPARFEARQRHAGTLRDRNDGYQSDAYHSLSIEGYHVTPELVERVRSGIWNPDNHEADRQSRDALAARGYWQAFQRVRDAVNNIIIGAEAGLLVRDVHREWYRELFQPCVAAGLIARSSLAGYRNNAVYLRGSHHVPPRWEAVRDAMPALFDLIEKEPEASVRAVLAHWLFGYIHPYPDGNGRMARFVMNALLASGGYPWTIIRVEHRDAYLAAPESASVRQDIVPFANFVAERVRGSIEHAATHGLEST